MKKRAIFLDRDGTINDNLDAYTHQPEHLIFLPGVVEGLKRLQDGGWILVIITNQSGIGRGMFTEEQYEVFTRRILSELSEEGVRIDGVYHCPHNPNEGCECRKPKIGMFVKASEELGITLDENSWMVGDSEKDVEAGKNAGLKTVLINPDDVDTTADHKVNNFSEAVEVILAK